MNPKAQSATSSATHSSDGVQASRLQSFPDPAGETPALPSFAPLSPIFRLLSPKRRAAAFTLLEVLVASAIMGIVMFVLVSTANTSLQLWRGTSEKMAADREGRSGMALLAWDLQNTIQPTNLALRPWINTNIITNGTAEFPMLRLLTLKPSDYQDTNSDFGDICYVEYRYTNYAITRAFVGSASTFASIRAGILPSPAATNFETLATNVWRFKLWGLQSTNTNVAYQSSGQSSGQQNLSTENLASIEYRTGILDQKFMKIHRGDSNALSPRQLESSLRWYQAIQPVHSPIPPPFP